LAGSEHFIMRASEDRYTRDLRRIHLAQRLIRYEVRTAAIRLWTGLTGDRVRKLMRSYTANAGGSHRHRGPPPRSIAEFVRPTPLGSEASAMTALALLYRVIPPRPLTQARRELPNVEAGERICRAFELYQRLVPGARLTLEQSMLLAVTLAEGAAGVRLGRCIQCSAALLIDPAELAHEVCYWCRRHEAGENDEVGMGAADGEPADASPPSITPGTQQSLF
jgi:hypothetical protein